MEIIMQNALKIVTVLGALTYGAASWAQDTSSSDAAADTTEATQTEAGSEPAAEEGPAIGQTYLANVFTDWQLRCVKTESGRDPCQLYQLLRDGDGNSVAEVNFFPIPPGTEAELGAQITTPLETLLTADLRLSVDGGEVRRYPYVFCTTEGCVSRLGFTSDEVQGFKSGAKATVVIVPAVKPDATVNLTMSLSGFTAGYKALQESAGLGGN